MFILVIIIELKHLNELYDAYTGIRSYGLLSKLKRKGKTKKKGFSCLLISINVYYSLLGSQTCFKIHLQ